MTERDGFDAQQKDVIDYIRDIIERTDLTVTQIARRAGLAPSTLTRMYPKSAVKYSLSQRSLAKLRRAFPDIDAGGARLRTSTGTRVADERMMFTGSPQHRASYFYRLQIADFSAPGPAGTEDLELVEGDFDLLAGNSPVRSPHDDDRYVATYMPSEVMEPRFRSGEALLIDRLKPAATGSDVLVQFGDVAGKSLCCIATLTDRDRNHVKLRQHRYQQIGTVHRSKIRRLYVIVGAFDDDVLLESI